MKEVTKEFVEKWARVIQKELRELAFPEEGVYHICDYTIAGCLFGMFRELGLWKKEINP